ncbi:MAG: HD domain-containing protein [Thermodesulfobacteriota bacterium]|nr:HD domain-containing protein [Thermodesulfobacteriota bacterium]
MMKAIANLLFEARILKEIPRSGFHFLGSGRESVAEHTFLTTFVGYVLSQIEPAADPLKTVQMCLIHDLSEARTGDLNYVQKKYAVADEAKAVADFSGSVPFGAAMGRLFDAFQNGDTLEARLAHDADQLALIVELKALCDTGYKGPETWLPHVVARLQTDVGKDLAEEILKTASDGWWFEEKGHGPKGDDT